MSLRRNPPLPTDVLGLLDPDWDKDTCVLLSHLLPHIHIVEYAPVYGVKCGSGKSCLDVGGIHLAAISDLLHVCVEENETEEVTAGSRLDALLHGRHAIFSGRHEPPDRSHDQYVFLSCALTIFVIQGVLLAQIVHIVLVRLWLANLPC